MKDRTKNILILVLSFTTVAAFALSAWALLFRDGARSVPMTQLPSVEEPVEKHPESIAMPGYESLSLKANRKKQTLTLPNPAENVCYFRISLYLEDGTLLWESELIEPGCTSKPIKLKKKLKAGVYENARLQYDCFTMDGSMTPLNNGVIGVKLRVS